MIEVDPLATPTGWYAVALSQEIANGARQSGTLAGREIAVFRTTSGAIRIVGAYCPHLGAHLGRSGAVEGESIRCGFHGFCFESSGRCVGAPGRRKVPPRARLDVIPCCERNGVVFAYHDASGREPTWSPPELDLARFSSAACTTRSFRGHPQDIAENCVDIGHLSTTHGYRKVEQADWSERDGPCLRTGFSFVRPIGPRLCFRVRTEIEVHGLGYSLVEVEEQTFGLRVRLRILCTPTEEGRVTVRCLLNLEDPARTHRLANLLPRFVRRSILPRILLVPFGQDLERDIPIWDSKIHLARPALADGDELIALYRRWSEQFYDRADRAVVQQLVS